ncbi:protein tyrosine phosphatase domain-containing protein 1 isoform X4 [Misgurnus anguillicaudatus]|uniref:protein tyrosine phosphatase domain-containing protein 1 isoform X4 n=1 Tax=Misgurnus anguillicaudatus TaxID=75329 RepID=UPI003CCF0DB7
MTPQVPVPRPSYSKARESLVKAVPPKIICILACGGRDCQYEGPGCWSLRQQAIKGVFSSWVTDDIIAMARPSTYLIKRYSIIEQFKQLNIKSIINMQLSGEHAHCGPPLETDSGFTYSPQIFMDNHTVYFYNFGMSDFGVSSLEGILDAVKVLAFSVKEGKVAVHCHAGLGRTGVLIACYLIYICRISASEAVHYVRIKRPHSIQTRGQISLVFDFARLVGSQLTQFPCLNMRHGSTFSLQQYLLRQAFLLHGEEARTLAYTPKILHVICSMLIALTQGSPNPPEVQRELEQRAAILALRKAVRDTLSKRNLNALRDRRDSRRKFSCKSWDEPFGFLERKREILLNKRSYSESDLSKIIITELQRTLGTSEQASQSKAVAQAMAQQRPLSDRVLKRAEVLQNELNSNECGWALLVLEENPNVLSTLLWSWLDKLKDPILNKDGTEKLTSSWPTQNPLTALHKAERHTICCLLLCVGHVVALCPKFEHIILQRLIRALTRRLPEEIERNNILLQVLRASMKELYLHKHHSNINTI